MRVHSRLHIAPSSIVRSAKLVALLAIVAPLIAACAGGLRDASGNPQIERIPQSELERIAPRPVPPLTRDDLVRLSRAGEPPERIIERIRATRTRFALSASQSIELAERGVDRSVLDYIVKADQEAARTDAADAIARRDAEAAALRADRDRALARPGYYPYYPYYPYPRFGASWGWSRGGWSGRSRGLYLGW